MKKLVTLLTAAGMVAAAAAPAAAVDAKIDYRHRISFQTAQTDAEGTNLERFRQRVRLGLTLAASENLKGYVQFQLLHGARMGDVASTHGDTDDVSVRQMYMDFKVPGTAAKVRMGRMEMGLPGDAFGENGIMAAGYGSRDGVVVSSPVTDWLGVTALWTRANYVSAPDLAATSHDLDQNQSDDVYGLVANLKFDGISGSVYGVYATLDGLGDGFGEKGSAGASLPGDAGNAYWLGFTSTMSFFDPFTLKLSAAMGEFSADEAGVKGGHGWNIQAKASYKMDFGTPVFGAFYFSGDDEELGDGTMPSVTGAFTPTRFRHDGSKGLSGGMGYELPTGFWGVQIGIEKMSFLKDLSHDFLITYQEGTNDKDVALGQDNSYLSTEDSLVEFNFINTYKIYKNLSMHLELSYLINDFAAERNMDEDDWGAELTFEYRF